MKKFFLHNHITLLSNSFKYLVPTFILNGRFYLFIGSVMWALGIRCLYQKSHRTPIILKCSCFLIKLILCIHSPIIQAILHCIRRKCLEGGIRNNKKKMDFIWNSGLFFVWCMCNVLLSKPHQYKNVQLGM